MTKNLYYTLSTGEIMVISDYHSAVSSVNKLFATMETPKDIQIDPVARYNVYFCYSSQGLQSTRKRNLLGVQTFYLLTVCFFNLGKLNYFVTVLNRLELCLK